MCLVWGVSISKGTTVYAKNYSKTSYPVSRRRSFHSVFSMYSLNNYSVVPVFVITFWKLVTVTKTVPS